MTVSDLPPTSFEDYVRAFPEGEKFRHWIGDYDRLVFLHAKDAWCALPGNFYWAVLRPTPMFRRTGRHVTREERERPDPPPWQIMISDADDTAQVKHFDDKAKAEEDFALLHGAGPVSWAELKAFGYERD